MGATHFLTKRLPRVRTEMSLHVLAYNLKLKRAERAAKRICSATFETTSIKSISSRSRA